jgi:hypothetical protein
MRMGWRIRIERDGHGVRRDRFFGKHGGGVLILSLSSLFLGPVVLCDHYWVAKPSRVL